MLGTKQFSNSVFSFGAVIDALRVRLGGPVRGDDMADVMPKSARLAVDVSNPDSIDKARYSRLLDHELDRQLMSEVEREDTDMLNRVRAALYDV